MEKKKKPSATNSGRGGMVGLQKKEYTARISQATAVTRGGIERSLSTL